MNERLRRHGPSDAAPENRAEAQDDTIDLWQEAKQRLLRSEVPAQFSAFAGDEWFKGQADGLALIRPILEKASRDLQEAHAEIERLRTSQSRRRTPRREAG